MMKSRLLWIALVGLVATLLAAIFVFPAVGTPSNADNNHRTTWPKNGDGVTYGSAMQATSPEDEPDLIWVEATNGKSGYVYKSELDGPEPTSPAAAIAQQKLKRGKPDVIPVYEVDGVTKVGVFIARTNGAHQ